MLMWSLGLATLALGGPSLVETPSVVRLDSVQVTLIEQIQVPAKEAGVLAQLDVREGSLVKRGEELGGLEDDQAKNELARAQSELDKAREKSQNNVDEKFAIASQKVAQAELNRSLEAIKNFPKAVAETEMDRLQLAVEKTVLQIEQARRDMKLAGMDSELAKIAVDAGKISVARHQIIAPLPGMVVQIYRRPGEWVNPGDAVLRILRLDRLRVEGFLDSRQFGPDLQGRPVTLTVDLPGKAVKVFHGAVVFVSPEVEPVTGQFRVWAEVENTDMQLRPGLQGTLTIDLQGKAEPLKD